MDERKNFYIKRKCKCSSFGFCVKKGGLGNSLTFNECSWDFLSNDSHGSKKDDFHDLTNLEF